jgi:hypothetical protein
MMRRRLSSGAGCVRVKSNNSKMLTRRVVEEDELQIQKILSGCDRNMYVIGREVADDKYDDRQMAA